MAEFRTVARFDELPELGGKEVIVDGVRICLIKHQGQVFATAAECPHKGAPLATGWVENGRVFCSLHGWEFDLRSGECMTNCNALLRTYPARIAGDSVEIALTPEQMIPMPADSDLHFLRQLSRAANEKSLTAIIIGGHAVNLHGVSRFTKDFDLLVSRETLGKWKELLADFGFVTFREAETFAQFSREDSSGPNRLDLMLVNDATYTKLSARSIELPEPSQSLRIVSVEHLIALKLHVLRQDLEHRRLRDFLDVVELIRENNIDLQSKEMQEIFERYGTAELFRRIKLYCE